MIRTTWVLAGGAAWTLVMSTIVCALKLLGFSDVRRRCDSLGRRWARGVLWLAGVRVRFDPPEREWWPHQAIIVANHQSWFDVFALAATLPITYRFVAKEELSRIPIFGTAWQACGHISLPREDRSRAIESLNRASAQVRERKTAIILFPEGTRSPDGRLQAFKKGAFVLAINNQLPVIPVGISGSRPVMPKGSWRIRSGEIRIRVGEPLPTEGLEHRDRNDLRLRGRAAVAALMEDPDGLLQDGPERTAEDSRDAKERTV